MLVGKKLLYLLLMLTAALAVGCDLRLLLWRPGAAGFGCWLFDILMGGFLLPLALTNHHLVQSEVRDKVEISLTLGLFLREYVY